MIPAADRWGPFASDLDEAERRARLRCLRAVVHLSTGHRGEALCEHLRRAENDGRALAGALAALDRPLATHALQLLGSRDPADRRAGGLMLSRMAGTLDSSPDDPFPAA